MATGVVDTRRSSYARLRPVPICAVKLSNGFWSGRIERNRRAGIPAFLTWLNRDDQTAPFGAFADGAGEDGIRAALDALTANREAHNFHRLPHHWRANLLAWVEACAFAVQSSAHPELRELVAHFANGIVAAHKSREFLDAYYGPNYEHSYQLATPGHLIQAAIAHHRATGDPKLLECAMAVADDVLTKFREQTYVEHPCIEMALVELYRLTGEQRYLIGARRFLEQLVRQPPIIGPDTGEGDWRHFNRHVVRQTYLCAGGADYLCETGDPEFRAQLEAIWSDMVTGKLHITGQLAVDNWMCERITARPFALSTGVFGVLQDHLVRGFELCEAVGNCYWNWRMLSATGDARYMDLFERTLYNGFLAHVSLEGDKFHYVTPLATDGDFPPRNGWGHPETSCCPPNALRLIAALPGYFYSTSAEGLWVHLYDNCRLEWRLEDGTPIVLVQETRYPWDGDVTFAFSFTSTRPGSAQHQLLSAKGNSVGFGLHLRIPGWCQGAQLWVNDQSLNVPATPGTYCLIRRTWSDGDRLRLRMEMPSVTMTVDRRAVDFREKAALVRGPLVYCFEGVDNPGIDAWNIKLPGASCALKDNGGARRDLYEPAGEAEYFEPVLGCNSLDGAVALRAPDGLTAIPYYAWGNRGPSQMRVWVGSDD